MLKITSLFTPLVLLILILGPTNRCLGDELGEILKDVAKNAHSGNIPRALRLLDDATRILGRGYGAKLKEFIPQNLGEDFQGGKIQELPFFTLQAELRRIYKHRSTNNKIELRLVGTTSSATGHSMACVTHFPAELTQHMGLRKVTIKGRSATIGSSAGLEGGKASSGLNLSVCIKNADLSFSVREPFEAEELITIAGHYDFEALEKFT